MKREDIVLKIEDAILHGGSVERPFVRNGIVLEVQIITPVETSAGDFEENVLALRWKSGVIQACSNTENGIETVDWGKQFTSSEDFVDDVMGIYFSLVNKNASKTRS